MRHLTLLTSLVLLLTLSATPSYAQTSVQAMGNMSYLIPKGPYNKQILHSYGTSYYDLRLKWQAPDSSHINVYDRALKRPILEAGLMMGDYTHVDVYRPATGYKSTIGQLWTLYAGMQLDMLREGRWNMGVDLQNGVGYCTDPFDTKNNADNEVIGTPLSIFVNLGLYARYRLSPHWSVAVSLDFKHYSNGTLGRPNLGANTIGPSLAVEYDLSPKPLRYEKPEHHQCDTSFQKKIYWELSAGLGMRSLVDDFNAYHKASPVYAFPTFMVAPMWRWSRLHATGIGLDYTYADYIYKIRDFDQMNHHEGLSYSPHILGLSLRHEVFYRQFSLNVGLGANILKHTGYTAKEEESWLFQHIGLRYTPPLAQGRIFVGYNIKAHRFTKADSMRFLIGYRL